MLEFLLATEFGQEILMRVQAVFDGALGPVHVAFEGGAGGVLFAPLEERGDDQHGHRENADGNVRGKPEPGLFGLGGRGLDKHWLIFPAGGAATIGTYPRLPFGRL